MPPRLIEREILEIRRPPVDTVKIDRTVVRDMPDDAENTAIIDCVLGLARADRRRAVAQGVESPAVGHALVAMGCDFGQGYGIGRPMPADAIRPWAEHWRSARREWGSAAAVVPP